MTQQEIPATPLFAGIEGDNWGALLSQATRKDLAIGQTVYKQGDPAGSFYVVLQGGVEVRAKAPGVAGEQPVAQFGAGAVLGETSLFLGGEHSASIYAIEETVVLEFKNETFMAMVRAPHPAAVQVLINMGYALAVRLRTADARLGSVAGALGVSSVLENPDKARKIF